MAIGRVTTKYKAENRNQYKYITSVPDSEREASTTLIYSIEKLFDAPLFDNLIDSRLVDIVDDSCHLHPEAEKISYQDYLTLCLLQLEEESKELDDQKRKVESVLESL